MKWSRSPECVTISGEKISLCPLRHNAHIQSARRHHKLKESFLSLRHPSVRAGFHVGMENMVGLLLKEQFTQKCTRYHSLLMPMESLVTCPSPQNSSS